jgi:hypothetical protein
VEGQAPAGRLRYVDVNEEYVFIVCTNQLSVYDRASGSRVLIIPAGRQHWDFYASPENQWRRTEETLNHCGELSFRQAECVETYRADGFHAGVWSRILTAMVRFD